MSIAPGSPTGQRLPLVRDSGDYIGGMPLERLRCPYCGREADLVWIHGHAQCSVCGTNVDECCRGEQAAEDEATG